MKTALKGHMNPVRPAYILLALSLIALLGGCFNRDRQPVYVASQEVKPIEVPDDLSAPDTRRLFEVPGYSLPELAAQGDQEVPPRVLSSSEAERSRSHIRFGPTGLYLAVEDEGDSVWRRLGFPLNRAGMSVRDGDQAQRRYRFRLDHEPIVAEPSGFARLAFWRSDEIIDYSGEYIAEVEGESASRTRVRLLNPDGSVIEMERAEFVLDKLRERLG